MLSEMAVKQQFYGNLFTMNRYLQLIVLLLCNLFTFAQIPGGSNASYYYFGTKKVYLRESKDRIYVRLPANESGNLKSALQKNFQLSQKGFSTTAGEKFMVIKLSEDNKTGSQQEIIGYIKKNFRAELVRPALKAATGSEVAIDEEFYVKLKPAVSVKELNKLLLQRNCILAKQYAFGNRTYIIKATAANGFDGLKMANLFFESGLFEYAEPDFRAFDMLHTAPPPPDDPLYNLQWAHINDGSANQFSGVAGADMDIDEAWNITQGKPAIRIAVLDEGVQRNHPDLINNIDPLGFGLNAGNANTGDILATTRSHGTSCAGIIAAEANNGIGIAGIAPLCKIIPVNITVNTSGTFGTSAQLAQCIDWAWNQGGADVLSNSWGGGLASSLVQDAIIRATTLGRGGKGAIVLFSSGNDDAGVVNPASFPETIAVGGVSMCFQRKSPVSCDGEVFWGANYGVGLDIAAPAVKIATTRVTGTGTAPNLDYNPAFNGTSSACPMVAGVAALVLSINDQLSFTQVRQILERSASKAGPYTYTRVPGQPNGSWTSELGHGIVNAKNAVLAAQNPDFCRVDAAAGGTLQVCSGGTVPLQVTNPVNGASYQWRRNETNLATGTAVNASQTGNYDVIFTTAGGCKDTSFAFSVLVSTAQGLLTANAGRDTAICLAKTTILGGGPAATGGTAILHNMRGLGVDYQNNQLIRFNPLQPALEYRVIANDVIPNLAGGNLFSGSAATPYGLYMISRPDRQFLKIDTATGTTFTIGIAGTNTSVLYNAMTYDATSGKIFAVARVGALNQLFEINRVTGGATLITTVTGVASSSTIISLCADNSGQLYGMRLGTGANNSAVLYRINKTTGEAVAVGNTGFLANFQQGGDVDPVTDQLYHFGLTNPIGSGSSSFNGNGLWNLNKNTGLATLIGSLASPYNSFGELAFASPEYKYQWSPATNLSNPNDANPQFTATTPGNFTYTLTITDLCGNTATDQVVINVKELPELPAINPAAPVLSHRNGFKDSLSIVQEAGNDYAWFQNGFSLSNSTGKQAINGTISTPSDRFTVTVTNQATGCAATSAPVQFAYSAGVLLNSNTPITVCDSSFYDAGGPLGLTGNNFTRTMTAATAGNQVQLRFYNLSLANGASLRIYDGLNTSAPVIKTLSSSNNGVALHTMMSSNADGAITVEFTKASFGSGGWLAGITCEAPLQFRSVENGLFTDAGTWESKLPAATNYSTAARGPSKGDDSILIRHAIQVPSAFSLPLDQTVIETGGVLAVPASSTVILYTDKPGYELTVNGTLTVNGNIYGSPSSNTNGKIALAGTLNLQGEIIIDSVLVLPAASASVINTGGSARIGKLQINNPAGVSLNGNLDISRALDLKNGLLNIPSTNFIRLISGEGPVLAGGSASSYINGKLRWQSFITSDPLRFPVGKNGLFRTIELLPNQNSFDFSVEYEAEFFTGVPPARTLPALLANINQQWYHTLKITAGNSNFTDAAVTIHYDAIDGITDPSALRIAKDDGSTNWLNIGGTGSGIPTGSITSNSFSTFSDFVLANLTGSVLPVTLISFNGQLHNNTAVLNWLSNNEQSFKGYEIERSTNGFAFEKIGFITAAGGGIRTANQFTDLYLPSASAVYYRLKMVDKDGRFKHSSVIVLKPAGQLNNRVVSVFPNPFISRVAVQFQSEGNQNIYMQLTDMAGKILKANSYRVQSGVNQLQLDAGGLPAGMYLLKLITREGIITEKLIRK